MAIDQTEFEDLYHALLLKTWTSEDFTTELLTNPEAAVREVGFAIPEGTSVKISRQTQGDGSIEEQYQLFASGLESGAVTLVVPEVPPVDIGELSESELSAVSGGTDYCCCPCCTCTA